MVITEIHEHFLQYKAYKGLILFVQVFIYNKIFVSKIYLKCYNLENKAIFGLICKLISLDYAFVFILNDDFARKITSSILKANYRVVSLIYL